MIGDLRGKVAVVTGAASGMGRAFAERFAREGMKLVLADVDPSLEDTASHVRSFDGDVIAMRTDVSKAEDVERLAQGALEAFGKVHLLCNNAGVSALSGGPWTPIWRATLNDWQWITGVNYWGVAHGIRVFVPIMLAQNEEGHVVNTASIAGLMPGSGVYGATKHAVVSMSESLYRDFELAGAKLGVTCLCPSGVNTNIVTAVRNRPSALRDPDELQWPQEALAQRRQRDAQGTQPEDVAELVLQAVRENRFYVLTSHGSDEIIRDKMEAILERRNPRAYVRIPDMLQSVWSTPR